MYPGAIRVIDPGLMGFFPPEFAVASGDEDGMVYAYGDVKNVSPGQDSLVVFEVAIATAK